MVLTSPEPINDGGRKYNWIYLVSAGILLIFFIFLGANLAGIFLGALIGLCVGWLVKNKILDITSLQLRLVEFEVKNKIPYPALIAELIPKLTSLGMTIEKSDDQNGHPVISYQKMIYDISYSDGKNTFTIWWRKNIARALITVDSIKMYRKIVVAMGIIGYYVQQSCNSEIVSSNDSLDEDAAGVKEEILKEKRICSGCGAELKPEAKFCPKCGVKIDQISEEENSGKPEFSGEFSKAEQEKIASGQVNTKEGIFAKIWNHPAFTMIAVKFGNVLDILLGAVSLLLAVMLLGDGFFGTVWGILFLVCGIAIVFSGIRAFLSRKREPEIEEELNKKKRNLCIGAAVIIIGLLVINSTGGGVYSDVKSIAFDDIGPETIGELIDENVKGAEWSQEKIDSNSRLVFVEGYCPSYSEDIRITFFYEDLDDGYCEVSLQSIEFPESGEYYDDAFSAGIIWASLYE